MNRDEALAIGNDQTGWVCSLPQGSTVLIDPQFLPCANSTVAGCSLGPTLLVVAIPSAYEFCFGMLVAMLRLEQRSVRVPKIAWKSAAWRSATLC